MAEITSSDLESHIANQKANDSASEKEVQKLLEAFNSFIDAFSTDLNQD